MLFVSFYVTVEISEFCAFNNVAQRLKSGLGWNLKVRLRCAYLTGADRMKLHNRGAIRPVTILPCNTNILRSRTTDGEIFHGIDFRRT